MDLFTHPSRRSATPNTGRAALVLLAIVSISISRRASADDAYVPHVRPFARDLARLVADGARLSDTFRALLDRLDQSKLIVHLEYHLLSWPLWARTMLVATRGDWRYVRVQIDCRLGSLDRLVMIGHELQHAVEIAESPMAVDRQSVALLHQRIGFPRDAVGHAFETAAARDVESAIRREVGSSMSARGGRADRSSAMAHR